MINKVRPHENILSAKNAAVRMKVSHGRGDKSMVKERQGDKSMVKELLSKHEECLKPINQDTDRSMYLVDISSQR